MEVMAKINGMDVPIELSDKDKFNIQRNLAIQVFGMIARTVCEENQECMCFETAEDAENSFDGMFNSTYLSYAHMFSDPKFYANTYDYLHEHLPKRKAKVFEITFDALMRTTIPVKAYDEESARQFVLDLETADIVNAIGSGDVLECQYVSTNEDDDGYADYDITEV